MSLMCSALRGEPDSRCGRAVRRLPLHHHADRQLSLSMTPYVSRTDKFREVRFAVLRRPKNWLS